MVSSLMDVQYHDNQFWMFTESPDHEGIANDYDSQRIPEFNGDFEVCSCLLNSLRVQVELECRTKIQEIDRNLFKSLSHHHRYLLKSLYMY